MDRHALDAEVAVELEAVVADVLDRQIGERHARARADADQFAVPALGAVENDLVAITRLAAECDVVGPQLEVARHHVMSVRDEDRSAGPDVACGLEELIDGRHPNHLPFRRWQLGSPGQPREIVRGCIDWSGEEQ